ncbi:MAG: hypothetical protein QGI16_01110 [Candidatus Marinimicrobia bacterium]|nr:hypothetical protein [Candidatus Neomarinimicrobiota bacterium]
MTNIWNTTKDITTTLIGGLKAQTPPISDPIGDHRRILTLSRIVTIEKK